MQLKKFQKYFFKNLKGLGNKPYKNRLAIPNLPSLECRLAFIELVFLYKIMTGLSDSKLQDLFLHIDLRTPMLLRRQPNELDLPKPHSDFLKFNFHYRAIKL